MKKTLALALAFAATLLLSACGGGGSAAPAQYSLAWDSPTYTITTDPNSTANYQVSANVTAQGSPMPPILAMDISPSGATTNPTAGNGPWFVNSTGSVSVALSVSKDADGTYHKGTFPLMAAIHIGSSTYTAAASLIVK